MASLTEMCLDVKEHVCLTDKSLGLCCLLIPHVAPSRLVPEQETKIQSSSVTWEWHRRWFVSAFALSVGAEQRICLNATWANFTLWNFLLDFFWKFPGFHQPKIVQGDTKCRLIILWRGWRCWRVSASVDVYSFSWMDCLLTCCHKKALISAGNFDKLLSENISSQWLHSRICRILFKRDEMGASFLLQAPLCDLDQ